MFSPPLHLSILSWPPIHALPLSIIRKKKRASKRKQNEVKKIVYQNNAKRKEKSQKGAWKTNTDIDKRSIPLNTQLSF